MERPGAAFSLQFDVMMMRGCALAAIEQLGLFMVSSLRLGCKVPPCTRLYKVSLDDTRREQHSHVKTFVLFTIGFLRHVRL